MIIGIDIDDTICDTFKTFLPKICEKCNLDMEELLNKKINYEYFLLHEDKNVYNETCKLINDTAPYLPLKEGAKDYIRKLHENGHKIIFITARSNRTFLDPYKTTEEYLNKNNIYYDKLIVGHYNKEDLCKEENIELFIDDSIEHNKRISELGINTILFEASYNIDCTDYKKVSSWKELYEYIESL